MATVSPMQEVVLTTQATVTKEGLTLPPGVLERLALRLGSCVRIIIHPVSPVPAQEKAEDLVQKLRTMLGDASSLEDEYVRAKDKDKR